MDWIKLEEGRRVITEAVIRHKETRLFKFYVLYISWILLLYLIRPPSTLSSPSLSSLTLTNQTLTMYSNTVSTDVSKIDEYVQSVLTKIHETKVEQNYYCLSAIHVGVPLRIMVIGKEEYMNPTLIKVGKKISKAYESSAFFPEKNPKEMTRFLPVTFKHGLTQLNETTLKIFMMNNKNVFFSQFFQIFLNI